MSEITQASWELHRTELRTLYLEKGMSLNKIKTEMDNNYGFSPSKSQYETAFKKWKFRKYLTRSDWQFVEHRIKKRKADDKETELYLNGKLVPPKRVKKELSRHFTPSYIQWYTTAPSPQTPQDIAVRTPKNPATYEIRLDNLPWFQFQGMFESHADLNQGLIARMFDVGEHRVRTGATRSTGSASGFSAQENPNRANIVTPATSSILAGLIPLSTEPGSVGDILTVNSFMQAISLEKNNGDFELSIQKLNGPFNHDALTEFLKYAAYLSSNNMLSDDQSDRFLGWVIETNNRSTLQAFFSVKMLTIEAFARCIFESTLRVGDAAVLRILLKAGVDPNPPTRIRGETPLQVVVRSHNTGLARILLDEGVDVNALLSDGLGTALEFAVRAGSVEMVRILLDAGAGVNQVSMKSVLEVAIGGCGGCGCGCGCGGCGCDECDTATQIFRILLSAGADVETPVCLDPTATALQAAAASGNIKLAQLLLHAGADVNAPAASPRSQSHKGTVLQQVATARNYESAIKLTQLLLGAGADINAPAGWDLDIDPDERCQGRTALQAAVESGKTRMVQILLKEGADVNASAGWSNDGCYGMTALQAAAYCDSVDIAQMLLDAGAEVNAQANYNDDGDDYGMTALQGAASSGSARLAQMLLNAGADVNAPAGCGLGCFERLNALERAAQSGSVQLVQMLLDAGADVNAPGCFALLSAVRAKQQNIVIVRAMIAAGADVNDKPGQPLLIAAIETGNIDLVDLFLTAGANVNDMDDKYQTALTVAINRGHNSLVQVLLGAGADVNALSPECGRAVLWAAVGKGNIDLVRMLLHAGAKVDLIRAKVDLICDTWVTNALPLAVEIGNIGMVQLLIEADTDVNASAGCLPIRKGHTDDTRTALLSAARRGNVMLVKVLLNAGANVNARPQPFGGWTALQAAAGSGNTEIVQILLDAGADINAPAYNDSGRTALQAAVINGHTELARRLLKAGADVNSPAAESKGVTALQGAAIKGQLGFALMLIQAGADPNAPPAKDHGRTALQGAAEHGRLDMLQLLLNSGADIGGSHPARARELAERNGHVVIAELLKKF